METMQLNDRTMNIVSINEVPKDYGIWPIGKNMIDGYVPFAKFGGHDGHQMETQYPILAVKCEGNLEIMGASFSGWKMGECTEWIKNHTGDRYLINLAKKAEPYFNKLWKL